MMKANMKITCPNCQHEFQAEDALRKHLEAELNQQATQLEEQYQAKKKALGQRESQINQTVEQLLKEKEVVLKSTLKDEVTKEMDESIQSYRKKIEEQQGQLKGLRKKEIEIEDLKGKLTDVSQEYELKYKRQLHERLEAERARLKESASEEYQQRLREKEKMLEDQKVQIEQMRKKIEQGSMQLQGEVQELILEEHLKAMFPHDEVSEVGKGMRGADVMQSVISEGKFCGSIIYESKNTQGFNDDWIDKLRTDQIAAGAQTAVLVTKTMPKGFDGDYLVTKNVVVCSMKLFPVVAGLCRSKVIDLKHQENRFETQKDKMGLMYQYLTSDEFRMHLEEVVLGVMEVKEQIIKKRAAFEKQWKQRDKQADRMISNLSQMFGSIKGIGGTSIKEIKSLDLLN